MAGFSLGSGQYEIPPESLRLYRSNEEISPNYNKGFELWHHQQQQHQDIYSYTLSAGPISRTDELCSSRAETTMLMRQGGSVSCQDCGNQAKKDCVHMRCRTCCKSRGFQCQTHVKSTWVSASRRRERRQQQEEQQNQLLRTDQTSSTKRPRENSAGPLACSRLPAASSGLEVGNFPAEVSSPAVFRCVKVSSVDDGRGEDHQEYAYQAAVNIGGHVFKGILYDQGPDSTSDHYGGDQTEITRCLITTTANTNAISTSGSGGAAAAAAAAALLDIPSSMYPPFNAFVAGTQFFTHPRS